MTRTAFVKALFSGSVGMACEASLGADHFSSERLIRNGSGGRFRAWKQLPMVPLQESRDAVVNCILGAVNKEIAIRIRYQGGTEPGLDREINPALVFTRPQQSDLAAWYESRYDCGGEKRFNSKGADQLIYPPINSRREAEEWRDLSQFLEQRCPVYVLAWCHQRTSQRCFRVSRMELV